MSHMPQIPHDGSEEKPIDRDLGEPTPARGASGRAFVVFRATLDPGESRCIAATPQVPFQGDRLVVEPGCAPHFSIGNLRIGWQSVLPEPVEPGQGTLGTMFPPVPPEGHTSEPGLQGHYRQQMALTWPKTQHGQSLVLHVKNESSLRRTFHAIVWGTWTES